MYQRPKYPNVHIRIFRKRWSLILGSFFPVSILKMSFEAHKKYIVNLYLKYIGLICSYTLSHTVIAIRQ